jgi:preprotein translocase subunit SecF
MHHIIGTIIGALVTYVLLVLLVPGPAYSQFAPAVIIGAICCAIWPWAIAFFLARRVKQRRDASIQAEVERQVAEQNKG